MNKKFLLIFLISIFMVSMVAPNVYAEEKGIDDTLFGALKWLTIDLASIGLKDDAGEKATFMAKLMLFIAIFAILFFVLNTFLFQGQRNISLGLALALGLIGVIAMPAQAIKVIFESYSMFFLIAFIALPIVALFIVRRVIKEQFGNHPAIGNGISAAIFWLTGSILEGLHNAITVPAGAGPAAIESAWSMVGAGNITSMITLAMGVCTILTFWYIGAFFMNLIGGTGKGILAGGEGALKFGRKTGDLYKKARYGALKEMQLDRDVLRFLEDAKDDIDHGDLDDAKDKAEEAEKYEERAADIDAFIVFIEDGIKSRESGPKQKALATRIRNWAGVIRTESNTLKTSIESVITQCNAGNQALAKQAVRNAIRADKKIEKHATLLFGLQTEVIRLAGKK